MGHFPIKSGPVPTKHTFTTANLAKMLHGIKDKKIDFTLKKKKFFGADNLESVSLNLTSFGAHSVIERYVTL